MDSNISSYIYIGTSGWNYKDWKNNFYSGVKQKEWLEHYSQYFNTVEVNATFYRMLKQETLQSWHDRTPEDFNFAIKGSRYITHIKRLNDPQEAIKKQKDNVCPLTDKLGAVIWQLPASLQKDTAKLQNFAQALRSWPEVRHSLEFRHTSWFDNEISAILSDWNLASCISDAGDWPRWDAVTTDLVYIRLHGSPKTYISTYSEDSLRSWAACIHDKLREKRKVYIYFDNTDQGEAPKNAQQLQIYLNENLGKTS